MARKKSNRLCKEQTTREDRSNYFHILPDEILTSILVLLPAELLRYKCKYVCRRWFDIISQILLNQASLIIQKPASEHRLAYRTRLVDLCGGINNLMIRNQNLDIPWTGRIRSTCNELLLLMDPLPCNYGKLVVYNIYSKEGSFLPRGSFKCCKGHAGCLCGLGIGFDKFRGVYKVVHVYPDGQSLQCEMFELKNESLFLNGSKWKRIKGPSSMGERKFYWDDPVSVDGRYFHWDVHSARYIISLDIVEEKFHRVLLPGFRERYTMLEMCGYLCVQIPSSCNRANLWILKHFGRKEWHRLDTITYLGDILVAGCLTGLQCSHPVPMSSLKNDGYIIYRESRFVNGLSAYKLKDDQTVRLGIPYEADERCHSAE